MKYRIEYLKIIQKVYILFKNVFEICKVFYELKLAREFKFHTSMTIYLLVKVLKKCQKWWKAPQIGFIPSHEPLLAVVQDLVHIGKRTSPDFFNGPNFRVLNPRLYLLNVFPIVFENFFTFVQLRILLIFLFFLIKVAHDVIVTKYNYLPTYFSDTTQSTTILAKSWEMEMGHQV